MTACAAKQSGGKISQKINLVFEKGIEIVENKEILSEEKTEEESERIFISDKNFIELRYGRIDLPESVLGDQYMIDRYKMIIWAKPKEESLEEQVDCVYGVLNKLREYKLFNELLLPARSKKEVEVFDIFDISEKSIESLILCK